MVPNKLTIHCSATPNGKDIGGAKTIDVWHKARGWVKIGYHAVINPDGSLEDYQAGCRAYNELGAHVEGHNEGNVGVCLVGTDKFTMLQWDKLSDWLKSMTQLFQIQPWEFYCHHDWDTAIKQGKTCPNFDIKQLLSWYLSNNWTAIAAHILVIN